MADFAINISLSLVEQIINLAVNGLQGQGGAAGGDINQVKSHLEAMKGIVQERGGSKDIDKCLRSVATDIEEILGDIMLNEPHSSPTNGIVKTAYKLAHDARLRGSFKKICERIQKIQAEMKEIRDDLVALSVHDKTDNEQHHLPEPLPEAEILGIHGLKEKVVSQLISKNERNRSFVVLVGPPGSGKTVLANSVCSDKRVIKRFHVIICACISPHSKNVERVLGNLKSQVSKRHETTGNLANDLKICLKGKRYLVLLDDMWREDQWSDIQHAFPQEESNGSRIIITTTKTDVATSKSIAAISSHIHLVDGLHDNASWELFCRRTFSEENGACPRDLEDLSREIVRKCEGSPLAISSVATLLGQKQRLASEWTKVLDNLRYETVSCTSFRIFRKSMLQSYDDLQPNLKSCLLYFALFPQGSYIARARLIRMWIAERFVSNIQGKPAEEVAEEYLSDLIRRHLVIADNREKRCRVRIFLHYFLTYKSQKEEFAFMLHKQSAYPTENVRRISVAEAAVVSPSKQVFTFIMLGVYTPRIKELVNQFKYLKVLDFQGAPLHSFPDCVLDLGLLSYLSLRGSTISKIPRRIKKMRYLEFLDLKHTRVTCLPKEICSLHNLRHLLVYRYHRVCYVTFDTAQGVEMSGKIGSLRSIQKLTLVKAKQHRSFYAQLGSLTGLQKLGLIDIRKSDGQSLCESLAKMKRLSVLDLRSVDKSESLDLDHHPRGSELPDNMLQCVYLKGHLEKLPGWIRSLSSLVRIHLKWSKLKTSPINELKWLENLTEMCLADAFTGDKLEFGRNSFKKLKVLQIEELEELSEVEICEGSLHKLEKLTLCKCDKLKRLPSQIEHLPELKKVVLFDMPFELMDNLRKGSLDLSKIDDYVLNAAKQQWIERDLS